MKLVGAENQQKRHYLYRADGAIASATLPQLIVAQAQARSMMFFQNISSAATMWFEIGSGSATATLTGSTVSSVTVVNGGFGYTKPPVVKFLGGGYPVGSGDSRFPTRNTAYLGLNQPNGAAPSDPAEAVAVLSSGAVSSISLVQSRYGAGSVGGSNYAIAPYVQILNSDLDPYGCADPSVGGGSGYMLGANQSLYWNGTATPTDPVAVFCTTVGAKFVFRWMD